MNLFRQKHDAPDGSRTGCPTAGELGHSQFGTPLNQIIHADVDYDFRCWIGIPSWGGHWKDPQQWGEETAPITWGAWVETNPGAEHPGDEAVAETALKFAVYGAQFGGFDPSRPFEIVTYLYLPDPRQSAIVTRVWVDDHPDLTVEEAAGVDDPEAIEKPAVEQFRTDALGRWLKVTRHASLADPDDADRHDTGIFISLRYAFKVPDRPAVVIVSASTTELERMAAAQDDLDDFVRTITLSLADGTPVAGGKIPGA
ncbi:MAG TPA: hypothetical protein VHU88_21980 [Sporichthyaceae bacterium]|jgi:hypothetical protein|nr:hypothetical protein [Sporichthyaceae bacterium]